MNERFFINSDFRPIGYFHTLVLWDAMTRPTEQSVLPLLIRSRPWWLALVAVGLLVWMFIGTLVARRSKGGDVYRRSFAMRFAVWMTSWTTGVSTMMLQITLLFAFQSMYGFVYELVGLITSFFMFGLTMGAWLGHRHLASRANVVVLAAIQCMLALIAFVLWLALPTIASLPSPIWIFVLFSLVTMAAGFVNGVDFPVAVGCYSSVHRQPKKSAGVIYAGELFGACFSAVVAGTIVVPVFGVGAAFLLASGVSLFACVLLLLAKGWSHG